MCDLQAERQAPATEFSALGGSVHHVHGMDIWGKMMAHMWCTPAST
jgi:hypothetical protein